MTSTLGMKQQVGGTGFLGLGRGEGISIRMLEGWVQGKSSLEVNPQERLSNCGPRRWEVGTRFLKVNSTKTVPLQSNRCWQGRHPSSQHLALSTNDKQTVIKVQSLAPQWVLSPSCWMELPSWHPGRRKHCYIQEWWRLFPLFHLVLKTSKK